MNRSFFYVLGSRSTLVTCRIPVGSVQDVAYPISNSVCICLCDSDRPIYLPPCPLATSP